MLKNTPLSILFVLIGGFGPLALASADETQEADGSLTVQISNVQNGKGQVGCSLYASKDGFPSEAEKAKAQMFVKQRDGKATCTFKGVKPGTYAVSVMHDENEDGRLETSLVGRPREWWGVSNDVPAERFGPPKYERASFKYAGTAKTIRVKLQL
jgi:uncharacterized protein (DUF2141 family)